MRTLLLRFSPTLLPSPIKPLFSTQSLISSLFTPFNPKNVSSKFTVSTSSFSQTTAEEQSNDLIPDASFKSSPLKSGLYLVATPIGNLEDITFRALRVLKSANVILSEDTRHSGKLLRHFNIKTPLLSYHKFNETQREDAILKRLQEGDIVALISDAGTPGISDPGMELTKLCIKEKIPVIPIPGASAPVAALSASGLSTMEFTFVGFLPKHAPSRKERLLLSANQSMTQIFFVPPHKLQQFLEETSTAFGDSRQCVIAREITKVHEEAVKVVSEGTSVKRKTVYTLALQKFGKINPNQDLS